MKTRYLFLMLWAGTVVRAQLPQPIFGDMPATATWYNEVNLLRVRMITTGCQANPQMFCAQYDTNGYTPYYLTRGQAAVLIIRALFSGIHGNPEGFSSGAYPYFTDVSSGHPQFRYIQKMRELGITSGCTTTTYCPDRELSYGEVAVFMYRARQKRLAEDESAVVQPPPACSYSPYWDVATNHAFCPYIAEAKNVLGWRAASQECWSGYFCPDVSFDTNQGYLDGLRVRRGPMAFYLVQGILDADYPQFLPNAQSPPPVTSLDSVTTPPLDCYADQALFMNHIALAGSDLVGTSDTLYITFGGSASFSFTVAPRLLENGWERWKPDTPLTVQGLGAHLDSPVFAFDPAKSYEHPVHHEITSACVGGVGWVGTQTGNPTKPYPTVLWANSTVLLRGVNQTISLRGVTLEQSRDVTLEGLALGAAVSNVSHAGLNASFTVPFNAQAGARQLGVVTKFKQEPNPNGTEIDVTSSTYVTVTVADPTPVLRELSDYSGTQGEPPFPVTLTGDYFGANPRVCINGSCTNGAGTSAMSGTVRLDQGGCSNCTTVNAQITVTMTIPSNATVGSYAITVISQGAAGSGWAPGSPGGSPQTGTLTFQVSACSSSVSLTYGEFSSLTGSLYRSHMAALGSPFGGSYTWMTSDAAIATVTQSPFPSEYDYADVDTISHGKVTITVRYTSSCGATSTASKSFIRTRDVSVLGYVDKTKLDADWQANPLRTQVGAGLLNFLGDPVGCAAAVGAWIEAGTVGTEVPLLAFPSAAVDTEADRAYANYRLLSDSANSGLNSPSLSYVSASVAALQTHQHRLFQRFLAIWEVDAQNIRIGNPKVLASATAVGMTLEPCSGFQISGFSPNGELHAGFNGRIGVNANGYLYQVNEVRVGFVGQAANRYLNHRNYPTVDSSTPYVYSVIQFDANGLVVPWAQDTGANTSNLSRFPTFWTYFGGPVGLIFQEARMSLDFMGFIGLDANSYYRVQ